jgi:hypothetical protein
MLAQDMVERRTEGSSVSTEKGNVGIDQARVEMR